MADKEPEANAEDLPDTAQPRRSLLSYLIWTSVAVCAVLAAAVSIALVVSAHRAGMQEARAPASPPRPSVQQSRVELPPAPTAATQRETSTGSPLVPLQRTQATIQHELARFQDALRALAAERDRLEARVEQLERNLGAITASITTGSIREETPPNAIGREQTSTEPLGPASSAEILPLEPRTPAPASVVMPRARPASAPDSGRTSGAQQQEPPVQLAAANGQRGAARSAASGVSRTEFAVDLGGEATIDGLHALWASMRGNHGAVLEGLRPLVSVRDGEKPGTVELRLVAGPLANAGDASRICAALQARGVDCRTAEFDGQRLASR